MGTAPPDTEPALVALLDRARREAKAVVLNGDVFDFWFEWRHVIPRTGIRTLGALAALADAGIPVLWIAGNHDCWGGDVLTRDVGVQFHVGAWRGAIGGWRTLIEHGDGLREKEDAPYRRLRSVLRHPLAIWAFRRVLHPDFATRIAIASSHTSRDSRPRDGGEGLRRVAEARLIEEPSLDLYVFGHSHVRAFERTAHGQVYANPGAFLDEPAFLRVDADRIEGCVLDGAGVRVLGAFERRSGQR
ncbi:MAG: metallophosphoesterase [Gemmatimonadetes bacterium]|nr:metallophosphoesterase [Gemmatimonadota bacterium]